MKVLTESNSASIKDKKLPLGSWILTLSWLLWELLGENRACLSMCNGRKLAASFSSQLLVGFVCKKESWSLMQMAKIAAVQRHSKAGLFT